MAAGRLLLLTTALAAATLAGCASPQGAGVRETPFAAGGGGGAAAAPPECQAAPEACGHEWWNLTILGADLYYVTMPVPAPAPAPGSGWWDAGKAWSDNLSLSPGASVNVMGAGQPIGLQSEGLVMAQASGKGDVVARSHVVRASEPETFLRARWGPAANATHPEALEVRVFGTLGSLEVTYEAHSAGCRREARYVLEGPLTTDATLWLPGHDRTVCW